MKKDIIFNGGGCRKILQFMPKGSIDHLSETISAVKHDQTNRLRSPEFRTVKNFYNVRVPPQAHSQFLPILRFWHKKCTSFISTVLLVGCGQEKYNDEASDPDSRSFPVLSDWVGGNTSKLKILKEEL